MQAKEEVVFTIIVVILVLIFLAILFLVFLARNNTRKNRLLFENERIRREFEETLLHTRLEIQEHTLDHVSREIHDNIGQTLSLARIQLDNDEEAGNREFADQLIGKAITDLRSLSHILNTNHVKEIGFSEAIASLISQFQKTGKYKIILSDDPGFHIGNDQGLIVFRVIQEVLNNIVKHANASEIGITIKQDGHGRHITLTDDGKGFDPSKLKSGGIGLKNITERIQVVGGRLIIKSELGRGTEIKILLPHE